MRLFRKSDLLAAGAAGCSHQRLPHPNNARCAWRIKVDTKTARIRGWYRLKFAASGGTLGPVRITSIDDRGATTRGPFVMMPSPNFPCYIYVDGSVRELHFDLESVSAGGLRVTLRPIWLPEFAWRFLKTNLRRLGTKPFMQMYRPSKPMKLLYEHDDPEDDWVRRAVLPPRPRKRILVLGENCQAEGVAAALKPLRPDFEICERRDIGQIGAAEIDRLFDYIFVQRLGPIENQEELAKAGRIARYPTVAFDAFQPDMTLAYHETERAKGLPGAFSSSLALYGFKNRLPEQVTVSLFNDRIFKALGFCHFWPAAKKMLFDESHAVGFPIEDYFYAWCRRGCFMHTIHHPNATVFLTLGKYLLSRVGIDSNKARELDVVMPYRLTNFRFPVYPEIASCLGISGSYSFGIDDNDVDLERFVSLCYEEFSVIGRENLRSDRIEGALYKNVIDRAIADGSLR